MNLQLIDDPYKTLGLERTATEAEIKQAYFTLVREHPPERDPDGFKRIRAAYEKLRAGQERAATDLFLITEPASAAAAGLLRFDGALPTITLAAIKRDLIALEAMRLLEDAGQMS